MYNSILRLLLYFVRQNVAREAPPIDSARNLDDPSQWWAPITATASGYGYKVDRQLLTTRIADYLLSVLPVTDEQPSLLLSEKAADIRHCYLDRIPPEATKPESLEQFLLEGTGSFLLQDADNCEDEYMLDLSAYEQYAVRPQCYRYGGKAYITDGRITHFVYRQQRYDANDETVRMIVRSSLCFKLLAELHALRTHLCTAQRETLHWRNTVSADDPLIDVLFVMTYGVLEINQKIALLVAPHGLVARLFAFTTESFDAIVRDTLAQQGPFRKREALGLEGTVWHNALSDYYEKVERLLHRMDGAVDEDVIDFFVASTALHNQFGDAQIASMTTTGFFLPKVYKHGAGKISLLDFSLMQTLLVAVSPRFPQLTDKRILTVLRNDSHREAWREFADAIREGAGQSKWFLPEHFETSVGF